MMRTTTLLFILLAVQQLSGQLFTHQSSDPFFPNIYSAYLAFSDVDGDGDEDVLITSSDSTRLYTNDGLGNFAEVPGTALEGYYDSPITFVDVDGDGDEDFLIGLEYPKLYTNDGMGHFLKVMGTPFVGGPNSSLAFSDVESDGDEDVLITGIDFFGSLISKLYANDGMGNFTEVQGTLFPGLAESSIAFSDVDNDGDEDVLITGWDGSSSPVAKLYSNDGTGNFTEVMGTPFVGVSGGSIAFSDVDRDMDADVLITGQDSLHNRTINLYINDSLGNFSLATGTPFPGLAGMDEFVFIDVEGDGDEDVLISSQDSIRLFTNDGTGNFTEVTGSYFHRILYSTLVISDVNGDGDPDILTYGTGVLGDIPILYENDGLGNFAERQAASFKGVEFGSIALSDLDGDGDQDILYSGLSSSGPVTKLYTNDGGGKFTEAASTPFDTIYAHSIAFLDVDEDGDEDVLIAGVNVDSVKIVWSNPFTGPIFTWNQLPITKLYLTDGMGNFTEASDASFVDVGLSSVAFADIDGDGDEDILISGADSVGSSWAPPFTYAHHAITKLYRNNGLGDFSEVQGTPFVGVSNGSIAFSDVDGDMDVDVLIMGADSLGKGVARLYANDGMGNFMEVLGTPFLGVLGSGIGGGRSSIAFSDVDSDGDEDVLISGRDISGLCITQLFSNDGMGNFSLSVGRPFLGFGVYPGTIDFSDIDDDGDEDLFITGTSCANATIPKLYLNDGMGNFSVAQGIPFTEVYESAVAFSDVDGDDDDDIFIIGASSKWGPICDLYINERNSSSIFEAFSAFSSDLTIYPNPTDKSQLHINYLSKDGQKITVSVFDLTGRHLMTHQELPLKGEHSFAIDISGLPAGTYLLQVVDGRLRGVWKFVVQ